MPKASTWWATFYFKRGDNSAAANRLSHVVDQYPLYSKADLALWQMGESYGRLGNRFRKQEGDAYARIVRDYPLSDYADDATRKLKELEMPVPEADKAAVARMQYEKDHRVKPGLSHARHSVAQARSGYEHGRAFGRSRHDHHAAHPFRRWFRSPPAPVGRIQRRSDRHSGRKFDRARYQTRRARQSARAGCGSCRGDRPPPATTRLRRRCRRFAATSRDRSEAKKKKKSKKQQQQPGRLTDYRPMPATAAPAAATGCSSIELDLDEPNSAG